jgi:hypothetical protein
VRYYHGLNEALASVRQMGLEALLDHLDALFGRDGLKYGDDIEAVREEAVRQTRREFERPLDRALEDHRSAEDHRFAVERYEDNKLRDGRDV